MKFCFQSQVQLTVAKNNPLYEGRCLPGDGKWMELEFAGRLFGNGLDWLEIVISVMNN